MEGKPLLTAEFVQDNVTINLIDELTVGICLLNAQGNLLFANSYFQTIFGYTVEELYMKQLNELFVTEAIHLIEELKNDSNRELSLPYALVKGKRKDNTVVDIHILSLHKQKDSTFILEIINSSQMQNEGPITKSYQELEKLVQVLDHSVTVSITDPSGKILYVNQKFCEISKYDQEELVGKNHRVIKSGFHSKEFYQDLWSTISKGQIWKGEVCNKTKDGSLWWGDATIVPFLDKNRKPFQYISIRSDITERKEIENHTFQLAYYDPLTELPNRKRFENQLEHEVNRAKKMHTKFSLMIVDLHGLKYVNNSLGTKMGDKLLQEVAHRLNRIVGEIGGLFRIDGDEFAVIFPDLFEEQQMEKIAINILALFKQSFSIDEYELSLTINIGVSLYHDKREGSRQLMKKTYFALRQSRMKGQNNYQLFFPKANVGITKQFILKNDLQSALKKKQFFLDYQPRIDVKTNKIVGAEALMRWNHPDLGVVSPYEFIPLAEEDGFIHSLGEMGLLEACQQNKQWQERGLPPIQVSFNFSVIQFMQIDAMQVVEKILDYTSLDPRWLEIELTESALIKDEVMVSKKIEQLKKLGVSTAIDDFGTGYASLSYLKNLKANTLKIDRSFVKGIPAETDSSLIVSMIIQLAKNLQIKTVAEGVETKEQLKLLSDVQCDEIQGYLYSKPVSAKAFESLLKQSVCLPNLSNF